MVIKLLHEGIGNTGLKFLSKGNAKMRLNNSPGSLRRGNFLDCVLDSKPGLVASLREQTIWLEFLDQDFGGRNTEWCEVGR